MLAYICVGKEVVFVLNILNCYTIQEPYHSQKQKAAPKEQPFHFITKNNIVDLLFDKSTFFLACEHIYQLTHQYDSVIGH